VIIIGIASTPTIGRRAQVPYDPYKNTVPKKGVYHPKNPAPSAKLDGCVYLYAPYNQGKGQVAVGSQNRLDKLSPNPDVY